MFQASDVVNGRFYSLWLNGDLRGEVKTASAESALKTEDIPVAGSLGNGVLITGATGTGSMTFYKVFGDLLSDINDKLKAGKPFTFDLISELNDPNQGGETERIIIEDCIITKFKIIDANIEKTLEQSFDFSYNPVKVTKE